MLPAKSNNAGALALGLVVWPENLVLVIALHLSGTEARTKYPVGAT